MIALKAALQVATFAASLLGTGAVLGLLRRRGLLDRPNERSLHAVPTPRGAGLALIPVLLLAWLAIGLFLPGAPSRAWWPLVAALGLAAVSWRDDLGSLTASFRMLCQAAAVAVGLASLANEGPILQGLLPLWADRCLAGLAWLWFVNLFNFMDGIDGLAGGETAALGFGVALVAVLSGIGSAPVHYGLAAALAALGFLKWNWPPARIFLGDVGSIPLGYLLGWLLLLLAARGQWAAALILPAYFLADATLTLLRRLARGERVWRAHRDHYYQRAVQAGLGHEAVVRAILGLDVALVALAVWAVRGPVWMPLVAAVIATAALLAWLGTRRAGRRQ